MPRTTPKTLWITRQQAAELCGIGTRHFNDVIRPDLPKSATKGKAAALRFAAADVVAAHVAREVERATTPTGDEDDAMTGPPSDMLERWREERWRISRIQRLELERTLMPIGIVREVLDAFAVPIRGAGDQLQKHHGNSARQVLDEAIDEAVERAHRRIGQLCGKSDDPAELAIAGGG
ncbi:MAG: hypothetical protein AAF663_00365 [Planctomycetota bacterium]